MDRLKEFFALAFIGVVLFGSTIGFLVGVIW